jgi:hypothetical protein
MPKLLSLDGQKSGEEERRTMSLYESITSGRRRLLGTTLALCLLATVGPALSQGLLRGHVSAGAQGYGGQPVDQMGASNQDVARQVERSEFTSGTGGTTQITTPAGSRLGVRTSNSMTPYGDPQMWPFGIRPRWTAGRAVSIGGPSYFAEPPQDQGYARIIPRQQQSYARVIQHPHKKAHRAR